MVDKAEEEIVLPNTCLRRVLRSFKEIGEDTFSRVTKSLMAVEVTKVGPRENFPRNWLFDHIACFDYSLRHSEITGLNFLQ